MEKERIAVMTLIKEVFSLHFKPIYHPEYFSSQKNAHTWNICNLD